MTSLHTQLGIVPAPAHSQEAAARIHEESLKRSLVEGFFGTTPSPKHPPASASTPTPTRTRAVVPHSNAIRRDGTPAPVGRGNSGSTGGGGVTRANDLPWCAKKAAVLSALVRLGATSVTTAVCTKALVMASGLSPRDCRHYSYHAAAGGLTIVVQGGAGNQNAYCITPEGQAALADYLGKAA